MIQSEADILKRVADLLAREAASVTRRRSDGAPRAWTPPPLLFVTDPVRTPRPWDTAAALPPGCGVIYRAFGAADRLDTARRLREATRRADGLLLIGLDDDLADACDADGVHLPEPALAVAKALRRRRPDWRLTGSAHSANALSACAGLDAALVSPVFASGPGSAVRPALGVDGFKALTETASCPVYALGGVGAANAPSLAGSGACGIAAVGAIQRAFGPAA
jgi:thiamine-phosphate pyrophosphorylase